MGGRRLALPAGVVALALAGGLVWGLWLRHTGDDLGDECGGTLAVEEAREFFGGADLEVRGRTEDATGYPVDPAGHQTLRCSVLTRGGSGGPVLRLVVRPRAAYRFSGAAERAEAVPLGHGWSGSFDGGDPGGPSAAVLLACEPEAGDGLLVQAEATAGEDELSARQRLQVARLATESARRAKDAYGCEGRPGGRPDAVPRNLAPALRPVARAQGTCAGVLTAADAARLRVTTVWERPGGRALTESCALNRGRLGLFRLTASYGPPADQEIELSTGYEPEGDTVTLRITCPAPIGLAYFQLVRTADAGPDGEVRRHATADRGELDDLLDAFIEASARRHGCQP
ncbi:hypothetical protein [Streptomyces sp. MAR4 CNX-425]|uniref:hypothetical protein n=1 Tax=Streptomyces sp. MAR4 CNX-425 TaxID=3406343 RepID=UPI003B508A41